MENFLKRNQELLRGKLGRMRCFSGLVFLFCLGSLFFLQSCKTLTPTASTAAKPMMLYNPGKGELHPDYVVYHGAETESNLFFRIFTSELLFNQANPETRMQSRIKLQYRLFSSYSEQVQDQAGEQEFVLNKEELTESFVGNMKIPTEEGKSYLLEVILTDQIRQTSSKNLILVDRFNPKSQQNFLILTYPGNQIAFEKFFYAEENFRIVSRNLPGNEMRVAYYKPISDMPRPPFSDGDSEASIPEPDSVWTLRTTEQSLFRVSNPGVYLFYPDPQKMNGVFLANFGENFPQVKVAEDMLPPLQYLTTSEEFKKLVAEEDAKSAVDEFWLEKGGSFEAARELIRVYYNRVVFSNLYFTTDRPGWKTDRGMIYLLLGPPDLVNKSETGESWIYKKTNSNQKYTFEFYLASDPIKAYEFVLKRTENHRPAWNTAVKSWREGRIFSL